MSAAGDVEEQIRAADMPADALRRHQRDTLRRLLTVAAERSPWHRERLRGAEVGSFEVSDIGALPVMDKRDLMDHFDSIVTDHRLTRAICERHLEEHPAEYLLGDLQVVASGGSSGTRGVFVYDQPAWTQCYASTVRFLLRDWQRDPALGGLAPVAGVVAASSPTHVSAALNRSFPSGPIARHPVPVTLPLEEIVSRLNALAPTMLMGYSSFLPVLAREAQAGRLAITPRRIIGISEPLLPELRSLLVDTWPAARVATAYGMSEGLFSGACGEGLHLPDDLCIVEAVDADGAPVEPGARSDRILLTVLYNHTLPLIRYEVTDELTPVAGTCPCGSAFSRIEDPQGRLDDAFVYDADTAVHPHVFRTALGRYPTIHEYQVRQTPTGAAIIVAASGPIDLPLLRRAIEDGLRAAGLDEPAIDIQLVAAVPRLQSGKLKRFVPMVRGSQG